MRKLVLKVFVLMLFSVQLHGVVYEADNKISPESYLPSSETYGQIESMTSSSSDGSISTRIGPDEPGWAQKESPIGDFNSTILLSLVAISTVYFIVKKQKLKTHRK